MAKKNASLLVKLVSTATKTTKTGEEKLTGYFCVKKRNPKNLPKSSSLGSMTQWSEDTYYLKKKN
nr:unnamed protein product [Callosobruchus chinensis]